MEEKKDAVSLAAYEFTFERIARHIRRLVAIIIALLIALVVTNAAWVIFQSKYNIEVHPYRYEMMEGENGERAS